MNEMTQLRFDKQQFMPTWENGNSIKSFEKTTNYTPGGWIERGQKVAQAGAKSKRFHCTKQHFVTKSFFVCAKT